MHPTHWTPEEALRALNQDRQALVRMAAAICGRDLAEDALQQACLTAVQTPPRETWNLGGWIARVVRNESLQIRRAELRRKAREVVASRPDIAAESSSSREQDRAVEVLASSLSQLREPYQHTLRLRYVDGLSPTEIAQRYEVPLETVRSRQKRALAMLRTRMDEAHGDRGAWHAALAPLLLASALGERIQRATPALSPLAYLSAAALACLCLSLAWLGFDRPLPTRLPERDVELTRPLVHAPRSGEVQRTGLEESTLAPEPATVEGQLLLPNGDPVRFGTVYRLQDGPAGLHVSTADSRVLRTDEQGRFQIPSPLATSFLWARADSGYAAPSVLECAPDGAPMFEWTLAPAKQHTGTLLDRESQPVRGATIEVASLALQRGGTIVSLGRGFSEVGDESLFFTADEDGHFDLLLALRPKVLRFRNPAGGPVARRLTEETVVGEVVQLGEAVNLTVNVPLRGGGAQGYRIDLLHRDPSYDRSGLATPLGTCVFTDLEAPPPWAVRVRHPDYATQVKFIPVVHANTSVDATPKAPIHRRGTARTANGEAVENCTVEVYGLALLKRLVAGGFSRERALEIAFIGVGTSNDKGEFKVPMARKETLVRAVNNELQLAGSSLVPYQRGPIELTLAHDDFTIPICGNVRSIDGEPLTTFEYRVIDAVGFPVGPWQGVHHPCGEFAVLVPGHRGHTVNIRAHGHEPVSVASDPSSGSSLDLQLLTTRNLKLTLVDRSGQPVHPAMALLVDETGEPVPIRASQDYRSNLQRTDPAGRVRLFDLPQRRLKLRVLAETSSEFLPISLPPELAGSHERTVATDLFPDRRPVTVDVYGLPAKRGQQQTVLLTARVSATGRLALRRELRWWSKEGKSSALHYARISHRDEPPFDLPVLLHPREASLVKLDVQPDRVRLTAQLPVGEAVDLTLTRGKRSRTLHVPAHAGEANLHVEFGAGGR